MLVFPPTWRLQGYHLPTARSRCGFHIWGNDTGNDNKVEKKENSDTIRFLSDVSSWWTAFSTFIQPSEREREGRGYGMGTLTRVS